MMIKSGHSWIILIWVQMSLRGVMLGEPLNLSKPWFPLLLYENNNNNCLKGYYEE